MDADVYIIFLINTTTIILLCLNFHKQSYNVKKSHSLICQIDAIFLCVIYRFANTEYVYLAWKYKVDAEPQIKKPEIMLAFVVQVRLDAALDSYLCPNAKHMFPIFIFFGGRGEEGYSCHLRQEQN